MKRTGSSTVFLGAALLLAIAGSAFAQGMMNSGTQSGDAGSMMAPAEDDPKNGAALRTAKSTGKKVPFTTLEAAQSLAAKSPVVLFFAADWCPSCRQDMSDINANGASLKDITVVIVDFDTEKALKRLFGVTVQHTFVQVDARGAKLGIWNGGGVDGILARVKRS